MPWFLHPYVLQLLRFQNKACYHEMRFEKDSHYYVIRLGKDLLDDRVITLINGRIKSKLGQVRTLAFAGFDECFEHFCSLTKLRTQRGYLLKTMACDNNLMLHVLSHFISMNVMNQPSKDYPINPRKPHPRVSINNVFTSNLCKNPITPQQLGFYFNYFNTKLVQLVNQMCHK